MSYVQIDYIKDASGNWLHISDAVSGVVPGGTCWVCGSGMVAKKGSVLTHHFAHETENPNCTYGPMTNRHIRTQLALADLLEDGKCRDLCRDHTFRTLAAVEPRDGYSTISNLGSEYLFTPRDPIFDKHNNVRHSMTVMPTVGGSLSGRFRGDPDDVAFPVIGDVVLEYALDGLVYDVALVPRDPKASVLAFEVVVHNRLSKKKMGKILQSRTTVVEVYARKDDAFDRQVGDQFVDAVRRNSRLLHTVFHRERGYKPKAA